MLRYTTLTIIALVVLRLAIGWHFLTEGWHKLDSQWSFQSTHVDGSFPWVHIPERGESQYNQPFSAKGYFQNAPGPFAAWIRPHLLEDEDDRVLDLYEVGEVPEGEDPATYPPHKRIPEALEKEWDAYLERFAEHYKLDETTKEAAQVQLLQAKDNVVLWLTYNPTLDQLREAEKKKDYQDRRRAVPRTVAGSTHDVPKSVPDRVEEYKTTLTELRNLQDKRNFFLTNVDTAGEARLRGDVAQFRAELTEDLDDQGKKMSELLEKALPKETKKSEVPDAEPESNMLYWTDTVVPWFLAGVGGCLLIGFFSRFTAVLGGLFLVMAYLAAPPFPWIPQSPATEGNPVYINKTAIEMLALFVLATIRTGAWFGLDALFARKAYNEEVDREKGEHPVETEEV